MLKEFFNCVAVKRRNISPLTAGSNHLLRILLLSRSLLESSSIMQLRATSTSVCFETLSPPLSRHTIFRFASTFSPPHNIFLDVVGAPSKSNQSFFYMLLAHHGLGP
ncbi:hypothetical protein CEXT_586411 [Caerostris extrusa]|uniref:Uncharacterized protein n=1 Tax=Caerostris extrusa TaxID=172846 RepID=A0AAV4RBU7_CAEEX|nr:hypothetical protein CEXT_586411 [Caerostris extrusa]